MPPTQSTALPLRLVIDPDDAVARSPASGYPAAASSEFDASFEPWTDAAGCDYGYSFEEEGWYHIRLYGIGSFAFTRHSSLVRGAPEAGVSPDYFHDVFCRQIMPVVLQHHSWEVLHASGLVVVGACVALCGDAEMGKSTLAHAWRQRGGRVYADDMILFRVAGGSVPIRSLPFRIRPRPSALGHHPGTTPTCGGYPALLPALPAARERTPPASGMDPRELAGRAHPEPALNGELLRAIYLLERRRGGAQRGAGPREAHGPVLLERTAPEEALFALLQQAICLTLKDRARNRRMIESYMALANAVPTFRLSYPSGLGYVDTILDRLTLHGASLAPDSGMRTDR